jgi:hypothetical protein
VDPQGQQTRVDIADLTPAPSLAPALFVLDKPVQPGRP